MTARHRPDLRIGALLAEASRRTLAPALRIWVTSRQSSLDRLPRPEDTPHAHAAGIDPQLEYGIGALKEMIQELPTDRPPLREGYRLVRPAPLPARRQGN